jgi:hypothetical protein
MRERVLARAQVYQNGVAVQLDGEAAKLVRELVERPSGGEIEPGVMPVAGEDPLADRSAVEGKAHVRAAVVDGMYLLAVREQADGVPVEVDNEASRRPQFIERRGVDKTFACDGGHALLLLHRKRGSSGCAAARSSRPTPRELSNANAVWPAKPIAESESVNGSIETARPSGSRSARRALFRSATYTFVGSFASRADIRSGASAYMSRPSGPRHVQRLELQVRLKSSGR